MASALEAAGPSRQALEALLDSWDKDRQGLLEGSEVNAAIELFNQLDRREEHLAAGTDGAIAGEADAGGDEPPPPPPGMRLCAEAEDGKVGREEALAAIMAYAEGPPSRPLDRVLRTFKELAQLEGLFVQWAGDRSARLDVDDLTSLLGLFNKWACREFANVGTRGRVMMNYYDRGTYGMEVSMASFCRWLWEELRIIDEEFEVPFGTLLKRISDFIRIAKLFKLYDWDSHGSVEASELLPVLAAYHGRALADLSSSEREEMASTFLREAGAQEAEQGTLEAEELRKWIRAKVSQLPQPKLGAVVARLHDFARSRVVLAKVTASFRSWDSAGKGVIRRAELKVLMAQLADFNSEEMEALMDGADTRKDGRIDYQAFAKWVLTAPVGA